MVNISQPDCFIKIGFKDGMVVSVDWDGMWDQSHNRNRDFVVNKIIDLLELAKLFIKEV